MLAVPNRHLSDVKFGIGHVLFIDIVGYSKLLINEQSDQLQTLNSIVRGTEQFQEAEAQGKLLRLPTGDGGALVFRTTPEAPLLCAQEIARELKKYPELKVRMGIHSGPVNEVTDLNEQANIAGAGINIAQRVMDCGDAGHILLSKRVAEDLEHYLRWQPYLYSLGECEVKHGVRIGIVNLYCDGIGNPELPNKLRASRQRQSRRRRWAAIAAALLVLAGIATALVLISRKAARSTSTAPEKSIAVLPFENLSHDPDNAFFAEGVQEEILARLSRIGDLKVISRTSTQQFQSNPAGLADIAKKLGVANIVEGSVQKVSDQVRVNVQLINAASDSHLWADKYDRKLTDIFEVESDIAAKIAANLQAKLTNSEQQAIEARPTENSLAHQLCLRGRYFFGKQTGADIEKAIDYFNQAIAEDPDYATAYAGLADCYVVLPFWTESARAESMEKARAAAEHALKIDDTLAEAHVSFATVLYLADFNVEKARGELERALELNANYAPAHQWIGISVLPATGEVSRATMELKRAVELDPFSPVINAQLGYMDIMSRRYPDAITQLNKTIELNPAYYLSHRCLGQALELTGQLEQATTEYEKPHDTNEEPYVLGFRAHIYGIKGDRERASQLLGKMKELVQSRKAWPMGVSYCFALAYLGLGDKNEAIGWLERGYENKEYDQFAIIKLDPMLDPLRGDPRFQALTDKVASSADSKGTATSR
jgi:TolB-like protein/Flp pilus assembly protein TadD